MKQLFLLFAATMLTTGLAYGQNDALNRFMEKHKSDPTVTYAYLTKDLFEVVSEAGIADKDWKKLHNVIKNIGSLSILAADSIHTGLQLYREARALVPAVEFDELLTVRDDQTKVDIWAKSEEDVVTDLILLVGTPEEFVLVCFAGNLELGNISELHRLFDAEAAEQLARTTETVAVEFRISPNPSNGVFTLTLADNADSPVSLSVIDQNGRQVSERRLSGGVAEEIRLRDLPAGNYWLQVKTQKGRVGVKPIQIYK